MKVDIVTKGFSNLCELGVLFNSWSENRIVYHSILTVYESSVLSNHRIVRELTNKKMVSTVLVALFLIRNNRKDQVDKRQLKILCLVVPGVSIANV